MKYRGILSIVGLILQGLLVFSPGRAAWAQSESGNEIGEGTAETPQLRPGSLCAILIGIDDPALANRARLTAQSDMESIGRAAEQLATTAGKSATVATVLAKDATRDGIDEAVAKCAGSEGDAGFRLLFYVGSLSSMPPPDEGKWQLTVAQDGDAGSGTPAPGIPLDEIPSVFGSLSGHPGLIVFDVYVDPDSGGADTAARALAAALGKTGLPALVLAATQVDALESPTASDSHVGRALSTALTSRLADEVPYGDSDGRISLWEVARYIMGHTERQWGDTAPPPQVARFEQGRIRENHLVLAVRPRRLTSIDEWKSQLGQFTDEKSLGPRLVMEARRALDGEHGLETLPEDRRAELIDLVRRLAGGEITADDYVLQRSILLGTPTSPAAGATGGEGEATGLWGNMSAIVKILLLVGIAGILVYLIARALLLRGPAPTAEESLPVMADDFLASGQTSGQTATKKGGSGKGQDPKRAKAGAPSTIRSIRPVGSPLQGAGAQSPPKGVTPPSPSRGTPGPAGEQRGAAGAAKPAEGEDETFENIDRPPSIAELRARSGKKGASAGRKDATGAGVDGASDETDSFDDREVEFDLDFEYIGGDETVVPGFGPVGSPMAGAPAASAPAQASRTPHEIDLESVEAPTPRAIPAVTAPPQALRPVGAAGSSTTPPPPPPPAKSQPPRQTTPSALNPPSARIDPGGAPISPGVLPAVIRAWDLEWTGPMARARFRIFMGHHLEMGRPARARDGEEAELMISLLPVGEDRKPNAALIAMLSRKAFAIDLSLDGVRVTVLNKASAHVSPDPLRPYWDWDNPMPGTERLIPPSETLWVSPHFGKTLAPISMKGLTTAGEALCPCAMEMHFDATFHDQVGITVLLIPDEFVMLWGAEEAAQILPNVGEGPALWLRAHATAQGLTITPLEGGKWSRRQGRMLDEQTLLLGGVSSVEWKTDRGEMSLKLTPHALPRLGTTAPKSGA